MGQIKIFIPDYLEEKIKATGRPAEEVISDLIRDYFQEPSIAQAAPKGKSAESTRSQNLHGEQEIAGHKAERAKIDQELAKESEELTAKMAEYEKKGLAEGRGKETLENIKAMEASIQDVIRTHKETERLVGRLEKTVYETDGLVAETKDVKGKTEERVEKTKASIKKGR